MSEKADGVEIAYEGFEEIEPIPEPVCLQASGLRDDKINEIIDKVNILIRFKNEELK